MLGRLAGFSDLYSKLLKFVLKKDVTPLNPKISPGYYYYKSVPSNVLENHLFIDIFDL